MALAQLQSGSGLLQQVVYCASPSHLACLSRIRSSYSFLPVNASSCCFGRSLFAKLGLYPLALSFLPENQAIAAHQSQTKGSTPCCNVHLPSAGGCLPGDGISPLWSGRFQRFHTCLRFGVSTIETHLTSTSESEPKLRTQTDSIGSPTLRAETDDLRSPKLRTHCCRSRPPSSCYGSMAWAADPWQSPHAAEAKVSLSKAAAARRGDESECYY